MSKPKIKFKLIKLERALVFQVLEQDERFKAPALFGTANGWWVCTKNFPALLPFSEEKTISVRGSTYDYHLRIDATHFKTNEERDYYFGEILTALRDWSQNAPQFAEDKTPAPTAEPDTYQF